MHVTSVNIDSTATSGRQKRLVTICVKLSESKETMTINVVVSGDGAEQDIHEAGMARAKDFARQFADLSESRMRPPRG
jgi:hypothetical protein